MLLRFAALVTVALLLVACGGKKSAPRSSLPPGCSTQEAQTIVTDFLAHPSVAPPPMFVLYRTKESDGHTFETHRGRAGVAHALRRLRLGERDRLLQLRLYARDINHVRITFAITRTAPDFLSRGIHNRIAHGTGTIDCAHGKIAAWSINGP